MTELPEHNQVQSSVTHYVLIVHGTFAAPKKGVESWYYPSASDSNFCDDLKKRLAGTPLEGSLWRSYGDRYWHWSGDNDHFARKDAAKSLKEEIDQIIQRDPTARIHLIAHSHGGNVVLQALDDYFKSLFDPKTHRVEDQNKIEDHKIGRLVFLGTPFYYRRWKRDRTRLDAIFDTVLGGLLFGIMLTAIICLSILLIALLINSNLLAMANPFRWPLFVQLSYGALILLVGKLMTDARLYRVDSNVYFDELYFKRNELKLSSRLPTLTVHSGQLDEALLLLSARPALDATLDAPIERMVDGLFGAGFVNPSVVENRAGEHAGLATSFGRFLLGLKHLVRAFLNHILLKFLSVPLRRKAKKVLKSMMLRIFEGAAMGLPSEEFEDCRIEATESLELSELFEVKSSNVAPILVRQGKKPLASAEREGRFSFLWDDSELKQSIKESAAWTRVAGHIQRLQAVYGTDDPSFRYHLQRRVMALEQRIEEIMGTVALDHSTYYESPEVIDEVTDFLLDGSA